MIMAGGLGLLLLAGGAAGLRAPPLRAGGFGLRPGPAPYRRLGLGCAPPRARAATPRMSLRPIDTPTLERLATQSVSKDQWLHFWGSNEMARASRIFEVALVSFFGLWTTWFLNFAIGPTVGTLIGTVFAFWGLIAPYFAAARRNADFREGLLDSFSSVWRPKRPLKTALFSGRIVRCERVVSDLKGRRFMLKLELEDEDGRLLQVRAPLHDRHADVMEGQLGLALMISEDPSFSTIERVSDVFIPAAQTWAGEYPYVRWERLPMQRQWRRNPAQSRRVNPSARSGDALPRRDASGASPYPHPRAKRRTRRIPTEARWREGER